MLPRKKKNDDTPSWDSLNLYELFEQRGLNISKASRGREINQLHL